ncbi:MAG: hypothetical protein AAF703_12760 [Cyanobacteria bacterium P01_D01_bin.105]
MTSSSSSPSAPSSIGTRIRRKLSDYTWPLVWLAILLSAGGVSLRAVSVMTQNPPLPDCSQPALLSSGSEQLLCARASVRSGSAQALIEAIELVEPWQPSNPLYEEANRLMNRWSKALLGELGNMAQRGDVRKARRLALRIPQRVAIYPQVKSAIATWDKEWATGKEFEAEVLQAIQAKNWTGARRDLQQLKILNTNYWVRTRHDQLKERIDREETARRQLNQARKLAAEGADSGDLSKLGEAFAIAQGINLKTAAWRDVQPDLDQWAERVMHYSFRKWEEEDIDAAIEVVQLVPPDLAFTAEAQDLLSFGHAQRLAGESLNAWTPSYGQVYNLLEAINAVQRISSSSPFYGEAQERLKTWQHKLDDMVQLQYASTLAQVGQRATYEMAIAKAQQITQERPQRVQAQTLVSHWEKEIQRIEDRPILNRSVQYAMAGGKANLHKAIAEASKVEKGRALRIQGQTFIAEWEDRIEIIEDQPLMTKAEQLAEGGDLEAAIVEASKIKTGRALHDEATVAIKGWVDTIQIAEDRPILIRAENLAARGSLTAAIEVASQIWPDRALYKEASTSIAIWEKERAYFWSLQAPAEDGYGYSNYADEAAADTYNNIYNTESFIDYNN